MSFKNSSLVHSHLSTKHPIFSHRLVEANQQDKILEPIHDEERFAERAPPVSVEESEELLHSH